MGSDNNSDDSKDKNDDERNRGNKNNNRKRKRNRRKQNRYDKRRVNRKKEDNRKENKKSGENRKNKEKKEDEKKQDKELQDIINIIFSDNNPGLIFLPHNNEEDEPNNEDEDEESDSLEEMEKEDKILKFNKIFDSLEELIKVGESYDPEYNYICNIDMEMLSKLVDPLKELNSMIGLDKFKKSILDQIVYILTGESKDLMLHTVLYGSPGVGKTQIGRILAKIYASSGLLSTNKFMVAKRHDFVGKYLGHTAIKTQNLLESIKGSVLFIDEAYALGPGQEDKDSFSKEAIDTLNAFLSENYKDFICIIAGYKEDINKCFFSRNKGLERRFTHRFTIDGYNEYEMCKIFKKFVNEENWKLAPNAIKPSFFSDHKESFPYYGGDIKTLFDKCKVVHSRKFVFLEKLQWKTLTKKDIKEGFKSYLSERQVKKDENPSHHHLYI